MKLTYYHSKTEYITDLVEYYASLEEFRSKWAICTHCKICHYLWQLKITFLTLRGLFMMTKTNIMMSNISLCQMFSHDWNLVRNSLQIPCDRWKQQLRNSEFLHGHGDGKVVLIKPNYMMIQLSKGNRQDILITWIILHMWSIKEIKAKYASEQKRKSQNSSGIAEHFRSPMLMWSNTQFNLYHW